VRSPEDIRSSEDTGASLAGMPDRLFNPIAQPAANTPSATMMKGVTVHSLFRHSRGGSWLMIFGERFKKFEVVFSLCEAMQECFCGSSDVHSNSDRRFYHLSEHPSHQPYTPREIRPKQ